MVSRRAWLKSASCGFGSLACSALAHWDAQAAEINHPLKPGAPHFPATAKNVIFLYMHGGASHIDTFDYRPELEKQKDKNLPDSVNTARNQFNQGLTTILPSPWKFRQYGESGAWASELFPYVGKIADELCFIKSMYSNNNAHTPATLELHTST